MVNEIGMDESKENLIDVADRYLQEVQKQMNEYITYQLFTNSVPAPEPTRRERFANWRERKWDLFLRLIGVRPDHDCY